MRYAIRAMLVAGALASSVLLFAERSTAAVRIDVTYTNGVILDGPLSFGLSELPESVTATFLLNGTVFDPSFGAEDVLSMSLKFGDAEWTEADLHPLSIVPLTIDGENGFITDFSTLSYRVGGASPTLSSYGALFGIDPGATSDPCATTGPFQTVYCRIGRNSNFELNIFGQDISSGESLHYHYTTSSQIGMLVPEPASAVLIVLGCGVLSSVWRRRRR